MKAAMTQQGAVRLHDVPKPAVEPRHVLVETLYSAISTGTELLVLRSMPEQPHALGYSAAGIVRELGTGVEGLEPGQLVACYGGPYVRHAEWLSVPRNLVAPVGPNVSAEAAAFGGLGAIAIHALRQAKLQFGETAIVVGLGILGQLIAQIATAAAYDVIGFDLSEERCRLLRASGAEACSSAEDLQRLLGSRAVKADAVLVCAGGKQGGLIDQALDWLRDRGTVVIVGDVAATCSREKMFAKEANLVISRAGGPGRYDAGYEREGVDYPVGYVRWTEGRNLREFIRLLERGAIDVAQLITDRYRFASISDAYASLQQPAAKPLGVLLDYADTGTAGEAAQAG
ncbi:MAG: zinc-binding alcohol dehydrogenase [Paenibacillaceae bacterium]|nr:zinc-binding alcohol dehydrogenase [Paenibacillaceae bacterium]